MGRKKVAALLKLQIPAGQATPAPPVGPALGQHGVNIMDFVRAYNAATESQVGTIVPVEVTVYEDRSFTFVTKTPPAAVMLRQAAKVEKGSAQPHVVQGGLGDAGAGAPDRPGQDGRPQRQRRRGGHEDRRGHGPFHGPDRQRADQEVWEARHRRVAMTTRRQQWARSKTTPPRSTTATPATRRPKRSDW